MIIETPYKQNDTVTIKTTTGEEIVARFVEETEKTITVQKPMAIMATQQGLGLGPFAFTLPQDAKVNLNKHGILLIHKTETDMASQYVQSTTGLKLNL